MADPQPIPPDQTYGILFYLSRHADDANCDASQCSAISHIYTTFLNRSYLVNFNPGLGSSSDDNILNESAGVGVCSADQNCTMSISQDEQQRCRFFQPEVSAMFADAQILRDVTFVI